MVVASDGWLGLASPAMTSYFFLGIFSSLLISGILNSQCCAAEPGPPPSEPEKIGSMFTFQIENDSSKIGGPGSDRAYTSGFKLSYGYADDRPPRWAPYLFDWSNFLKKDALASQTNYVFSFAQKLYTPDNTQQVALIPNDQPYAGWLYAGFGTNLKRGDHGHSIELDVGVIGPIALGEQTQNTIHKIIGDQTAKGWNNQLRNEPALEISYQQRGRFFKIERSGGTIFDTIPYWGIALGNVLDAAQVGGLIRFGYHLPADLGPSRPSTLGSDAYLNPRRNDRKNNKVALFGFAGISGSGVAHNIFLDGNTFVSSPHVTRIPFVYDIEEGIGMRLYDWYVSWKYVVRSPEFKEMNRRNAFASLQLTYSFPN
jgi:lipid A 3-O-deacylase